MIVLEIVANVMVLKGAHRLAPAYVFDALVPRIPRNDAAKQM